MMVLIRTLVIVLSLLLADSLAAHQLKQAVSRVLFNERTGYIEVMHRFNLHDAEHACNQIFRITADLHTMPGMRAQFADYVADHFQVWDNTGKPVKLDVVGQEIEGKHLWVYQQTELRPYDSLKIQFNALQEIWPTQTNLINVERKKQISSLVFRGAGPIQTLDLSVSK